MQHYQSVLQANKYGEASRAILMKMANLDFMYMPYAKRQLKINPYLKQNPQYVTEETTSKN